MAEFEKAEDIKMVVINWRDREIELHNTEPHQNIGLPVARVKFAKSSPVGLILQGLTKWCFGHYREELS